MERTLLYFGVFGQAFFPTIFSWLCRARQVAVDAAPARIDALVRPEGPALRSPHERDAV